MRWYKLFCSHGGAGGAGRKLQQLRNELQDLSHGVILGVFYLTTSKTGFVAAISFMRPSRIARKGRRAFGHTSLFLQFPISADVSTKTHL